VNSRMFGGELIGDDGYRDCISCQCLINELFGSWDACSIGNASGKKGIAEQQRNGKDANCILIIPYLTAMQACFGINLYDKMHVFYFGIRGQWS
jgi:hypothetical protein